MNPLYLFLIDALLQIFSGKISSVYMPNPLFLIQTPTNKAFTLAAIILTPDYCQVPGKPNRKFKILIITDQF